MRLIDADKIGLTDFEILMCDGSYKGALEALISNVERQPTVDAVPVIRCKDCKYYEPKDRNFSCNLFSDLGSANNDDGFCAWAEREEK